MLDTSKKVKYLGMKYLIDQMWQNISNFQWSNLNILIIYYNSSRDRYFYYFNTFIITIAPETDTFIITFIIILFYFIIITYIWRNYRGGRLSNLVIQPPVTELGFELETLAQNT